MIVKNKLRDIRYTEYKMDQNDFAAFLEVGKNPYNKWENNKGQPNLAYALLISQKTKKHVEEIFYLE